MCSSDIFGSVRVQASGAPFTKRAVRLEPSADRANPRAMHWRRAQRRWVVSSLRQYVTWIAALAAIILVWLQLPEDWPIAQPTPGETLNQVLTWIFWILAIVIVLVLFTDRHQPEASVVEVEGPAFTRYLFSNTRAGLFWLPIRLFLGMSWFEAGWHKFTGEGWLDGGASLAGY